MPPPCGLGGTDCTAGVDIGGLGGEALLGALLDGALLQAPAVAAALLGGGLPETVGTKSERGNRNGGVLDGSPGGRRAMSLASMPPVTTRTLSSTIIISPPECI